MEVCKTNFDEWMDTILKEIGESVFISIDINAEVTGFIMGDESLNMKELKGAEWYDVIRSKERTRSPLEFGIAMFKNSKNMEPMKTKSFTVKSYNVPILMAYVEEHDARQDIRDAKEIEERLDIDAIGYEFIQKINFDLNKSLYDGAPFLNKERAAEAADYMTNNPSFMVIDGKHVTNGDLDRAYFPKLIEKLEPSDIQEILHRLRGIGKFLDVTSRTRVPVVGHNLFIKLILLYKDFVEFLPQRYSELIPKLERFLPEFYDTKYMCWEIAENSKTSGQKRMMTCNSQLYPLYRNTNWIGQFTHAFHFHEKSTKIYENELTELESELLENDPKSFCYECGFDAVVTGIVFTKLSILAFGDFSLKMFPEYARRWKNTVFIQNELRSVLYDHEKAKDMAEHVAVAAGQSRPNYTWANVVRKY